MSELTRPVDPTTLLFRPLGERGAVDPAAALRRYQEAANPSALSADVPDALHKVYETICRRVHAGVFDYDSFTAAHHDAILAIETALMTRFQEHYRGGVPIHSGGITSLVQFSSFSEVYRHFRMKPKPRLVGHPTFWPDLTGLFMWARREGHLDGQGNRNVERGIVGLRNLAAHLQSFMRLGPHDALMSVRDLAEISNRLFGKLTPGGRLYPEPFRRHLVVLGQGELGTTTFEHRTPWPADLEQNWRWWLLLAVDHDRLWDYAPDVDLTLFPVHRVAGPLSLSEIKRVPVRDVVEDAVGHQDRLFFVRITEDVAEAPRNPRQLVDFRQNDLSRETWLPIRADYPQNALAHGRRVLGEECRDRGFCEHCVVEQLERRLHGAAARKWALRELAAAGDGGREVGRAD